MLANDVVQPALAGGLVLIVLLIGFTVMQHAFAGGAVHAGPDQRHRAPGAGADRLRRHRLGLGRAARPHLHRPRGRGPARPASAAALEGPARDWLEVLHPDDRDRFRTTLDAVVEQRRGRIAQDFRLRARGRPLPLVPAARPAGARLRRRGDPLRRHAARRHRGEDRRGAPAARRRARQPDRPAQPRAVPRPARAAITRAEAEGAARPSVFILDIDRFKQVNDGFGLVGRRLDPAHHRAPADAAAQAAGHAGALRRRPVRLPAPLRAASPSASPASPNAVRRALRAPITFGEREIFLTASIGIAMHDGKQIEAEEMVKDAEIGMYHAKRLGGDRIEAFRPALRQHGTDLAHARIRPPPRARPRGDQGPLPADRAARGQDHRRLRGAGALGPSEARPHPAGGLHPDRRAHRPDHPARPLRPRPHRAAARRLAGGARPLDVALRQRQRVEPPAAPPRPDQRREVGAGPLQRSTAAR